MMMNCNMSSVNSKALRIRTASFQYNCSMMYGYVIILCFILESNEITNENDEYKVWSSINTKCKETKQIEKRNDYSSTNLFVQGAQLLCHCDQSSFLALVLLWSKHDSKYKNSHILRFIGQYAKNFAAITSRV
jgi:hypothetical protein